MAKKSFTFYLPVLLPKVNMYAEQQPTVTMGNCAIMNLVKVVVSVNHAQEKLTKIASLRDTSPISEPLNAKVFVSSNKVSFSILFLFNPRVTIRVLNVSFPFFGLKPLFRRQMTIPLKTNISVRFLTNFNRPPSESVLKGNIADEGIVEKLPHSSASVRLNRTHFKKLNHRNYTKCILKQR